MDNRAEECELHGIAFCVDCFPQSRLVAFHDLSAKIAPETTDVWYWTEPEIRMAEDLNLSDEDLAEATGRTRQAVHVYRYRHGIVAKQNDRNLDYDAPRVMARWTEGELDFIQSHLESMTPEEMAATLGRSVPAVMRMVARFR